MSRASVRGFAVGALIAMVGFTVLDWQAWVLLVGITTLNVWVDSEPKP